MNGHFFILSTIFCHICMVLSTQNNVTELPKLAMNQTVSGVMPPSLFAIILATFFLIESVFILYLNGFAIVVIIAKKKMQTRVNKVILSLLVADLFIGVELPFHASFLLVPTLSLNHYACVIRYAINYFCVLASVLSLLLITIDRYVAIVHPYHYLKHGSLPRHNLFLVGIWAYSFGYGIAVILWHRWPVACNPESIMPPG